MIMECAIAGRDPCEYHKCPTGSKCKVFEVTSETYCEASCDLDNGGCAANQSCSLKYVKCVRAPCPPVVECGSSKLATITICICCQVNI